MEIEFLQEFISAQIQTPPRYLFVTDQSRLTQNLTEIQIRDYLYQVVYFENDLQLRTELEWTKTDGFDLNFCIISSKIETENKTIQDFLQRATVIKITPQLLLNFVGNSRWSEATNWLQGRDFWRCFDTLNRVKNRPDLVSTDQDFTYLTSALIGVNLSRRFDPVSGFLFYFKKMKTDTFKSFQTNYPQLARFVTEKLFSEVPELKAFEENPDLLNDLWAGQYAQLPARLSDTAEAEDLKYQMAIKAPNFVQQQITDFEASHLNQNEQIQAYLKANQVADTWQGWLNYLQREKMLTAPVKLIFKKIVNYLLRNPGMADLAALQSAIRTLTQHQALRSVAQAGRLHDSLPALFTFFSNLVEILIQIKNLQLHLTANMPEIIKTIYPEFLAHLTRQLNQLETDHLRLKFVEDGVLKKIAETTRLLRDQFNALFVQWITVNWQQPLQELTNRLDLVAFPFQILKANFAEKEARPVIVLLFDGMRWDGWELLKPHFATIFPTQMQVNPMLTPLPGLTRISRPYLLSGNIAAANEWETLRRTFPNESIEVFFYEDSPSSHRESLNLLQSSATIKIMLFNLFDRRIHHSRLSLNLLYREVETEFQENILPVLAQIPKNSKIIITSDHGFLQVTGKWLPQIQQDLPKASDSHHRRFAKLPPRLADRKYFVFLETVNSGDPAEAYSGLAFLKQPQVLKHQPNESCTRYAHGGISLEEMIVPLVRVDYK